MKNAKLETILERYTAEITAVLGNQLLSVILYGSAVCDEYRHGKSDINIALLLQDNSLDVLKKFFSIDRRWRPAGIPTPFCMTPAYISASLDTYPVEFLNMQLAYRILKGSDPLQRLKISNDHLRIQCERELKGIALHLRSGFVHDAGKPSLLLRRMDATLSSLMPVLRGLLILRGREVPSTRRGIACIIGQLYPETGSVLTDLYGQADRHSGGSEVFSLFGQFLAMIDFITSVVDSISKEDAR